MKEVRAKVTRNYQVTIPIEVRKLLGIEIGSYVRFVIDESSKRVYIEKVGCERKTLRLGRKLDPEEIERVIEKGLAECLK